MRTYSTAAEKKKKAERSGSLGKLIAGISVHLHGMTSLKSFSPGVADSGNSRLGAEGPVFVSRWGKPCRCVADFMVRCDN